MDIFFFFFFWWGGVIIKLIGLYLRVISMQLGYFKANVQNGGYFGGLVKFQIFWGCFKLLIFFGVNGRCLARTYVWREK